ncbi:hypothetical protein Ssi03_64230 [Sphaerisporangium siamense]|uniref:Uncharacterized protein n=1 Tax=Sphaerisporangium siamense TaxID=795645 RepID=A0A7W7G603_9ACTN|nr:hypothetical protein [Sphaerisporangium siamense]MBB4699038.1 hypothetical protein [Sphaerisporangium siamense]GII88433.1 hypothetical protein Ssi03_64230 [Sphaerisporangium siamense]
MNPRNTRHGSHHLAPPPPPGALTRLWRRRSEVLLATGAVVFGVGAYAAHGWVGFGLLTGLVAAPATVRAGRSRFVAHFWCVYSRRRMQRVFMNTSLQTPAGRVPLILWITPTPAGEKALILCRAGISPESFHAYAAELAAACGAGAARVARHRKWSNLVTVEIVRRTAVPAREPVGVHRLISDPYRWESLDLPYPEAFPEIAGRAERRDRREDVLTWH